MTIILKYLQLAKNGIANDVIITIALGAVDLVTLIVDTIVLSRDAVAKCVYCGKFVDLSSANVANCDRPMVKYVCLEWRGRAVDLSTYFMHSDDVTSQRKHNRCLGLQVLKCTIGFKRVKKKVTSRI